MSLSIYNLKKWAKMMRGNSILHVNQGVGRYYKKDAIAGYYNDLIEKVKKSGLRDEELPVSSNEKNEAYHFPIAIFQYGLGAYDLYLQEKDKKYLISVRAAGDWAIDNQKKDGGWVCFSDYGEENTYSSMGQGEGISLLARCYSEFGEKKYLDAIKKAAACLIRPIDKKGTASYRGNKVFFKEYPEKPVVLNGWIFSIFGIYDYLLLFPKDRVMKEVFEKTLNTLEQEINNYDLGYWSKYDADEKIASPFYHRLHVSLLIVLYDLTGFDKFMVYANKFKDYNRNKSYARKAFVKKSFQKIMEK